MVDIGFWASVIVGVGVAGHAVVGVVLTTRLAGPTRRLWRRFGERTDLLQLNGTLLVVASALHLIISAAKAYDEGALLFVSSVAPFPFFMVAGWMERGTPGSLHHWMMAAGWVAFAGHGAVVGL